MSEIGNAFAAAARGLAINTAFKLAETVATGETYYQWKMVYADLPFIPMSEIFPTSIMQDFKFSSQNEVTTEPQEVGNFTTLNKVVTASTGNLKIILPEISATARAIGRSVADEGMVILGNLASQATPVYMLKPGWKSPPMTITGFKFSASSQRGTGLLEYDINLIEIDNNPGVQSLIRKSGIPTSPTYLGQASTS